MRTLRGAQEAALRGKGAGPGLGRRRRRRRRGWVAVSPVRLPAAKRQRGWLCAHGGAGAPALPCTMILWLCLCWGFSPSAGQPDSELMARYLEEQLLADYSIVEQVGFEGGGLSGSIRWPRMARPRFTSSIGYGGSVIKMHLFHLCVRLSSVGGVTASVELCWRC